MFQSDALNAGGKVDWEDIDAQLKRTLDNHGEEVVPVSALQTMFTLAVKQYSQRYEDQPDLVPMHDGYVTATDVANSVLEMLRVVDLELFELTLWGSRIAKESPVANHTSEPSEEGQ